MTELLTFSPVAEMSWISVIVLAVIIVCSVYFVTSWIWVKKFKRPQHCMTSCEQDVIVIGAGVVGTATAVTLAKQGHRVKVIERDMSEPDRIVGELMQPGGIIALQKLGLQDATSNIDCHHIKGYIIHDNVHNTQLKIPYPELDNQEGRAFHHGRFIMGMRKEMLKEKNIEVIEGSALSLIEDNGVVIGVKVKVNETETKKEFFAPLTVVADGCFSRFRKDTAKVKPKTKSHFVGMIMTDCPQAEPHHAELVMTTTSPVLIYQISSHSTRVLVDIRGPMPRDLKGYLRDEVAPQMPEHLGGPFADAILNDRVRSMPNSFLPACPLERPGVIALGDAYNMRHPLTGGGMSVALNDVVLWKDLLKTIPDLSDYEAIMKAQRSFNWQRKNTHAFVINVLSFALYELFAANDAHLYRLKEACFAYFALGGSCVSGPVGLLSVLRPRPHVLLGHFFAVALYAVWFCFVRAGWRVHNALCESSGVMFKACKVIFPLIWSEVKTFVSF